MQNTTKGCRNNIFNNEEIFYISSAVDAAIRALELTLQRKLEIKDELSGDQNDAISKVKQIIDASLD